MNVHPPTDRHVPATYYSAVAHEAYRVLDRNPVRSVKDVVDTAFGFTRVQPGIDPGSEPTAAEYAIVHAIFPLLAWPS